MKTFTNIKEVMRYINSAEQEIIVRKNKLYSIDGELIAVYQNTI